MPKKRDHSICLLPLCNHYVVSLQYILSKISYQHIVNNVSQLSSPQLLHVGRMCIYEVCSLKSDVKTRLLVDRRHEEIPIFPGHYPTNMSEICKNNSQ